MQDGDNLGQKRHADEVGGGAAGSREFRKQAITATKFLGGGEALLKWKWRIKKAWRGKFLRGKKAAQQDDWLSGAELLKKKRTRRTHKSGASLVYWIRNSCLAVIKDGGGASSVLGWKTD